MRFSLLGLTLGAGLLLLDSLPAHAEGWLHHRRPFSWFEPNPPAATTIPGTVVPGVMTPGTVAPQATPGTPAPVPMQTAEPDVGFPSLVSAALGDDYLAVASPGYLDSAIPTSQFRLRYDSAYNIDRPDRAEYFYGKCGCFGGFAPGPRRLEATVDAQEVAMYLEIAPTKRFSGFIELPVRSINPDFNDNSTGLGDLRVGFKYAMIADDDQFLTFQFRAFLPTGDAERGLGTNHYTVEPSLLYWKKLGEKLNFYAQVGDWIPIDGTDFAGNVLQYGAGLGYTVHNHNGIRVTPLVEFLGWSVLGGQEFSAFLPPTGVRDAGGVNVMNGKIGVRIEGERHNVYVGYGHALTEDIWYRDIVRLEYRLKF